MLAGPGSQLQTPSALLALLLATLNLSSGPGPEHKPSITKLLSLITTTSLVPAFPLPSHNFLLSIKTPMDFMPNRAGHKSGLEASKRHPSQCEIFNTPLHLLSLKLISLLEIWAAVLLNVGWQRMQTRMFRFHEPKLPYLQCLSSSGSLKAHIYTSPRDLFRQWPHICRAPTKHHPSNSAL